MEKRYFAESELIINADGSVFHLHLKPNQLADTRARATLGSAVVTKGPGPGALRQSTAAAPSSSAWGM